MVGGAGEISSVRAIRARERMVGSRDLLILQKERHSNVRAHLCTDSEGLITRGVAIDHGMLLFIIIFINGI